jgi:hypothetical protein
MVHEVVQKATERQGSEVIYRQNLERNIDNLKFRIDLIEDLVKYSILRGVSGHHDGDNKIDRLTQRHIPRRIPPTEKECKSTRLCVECSKLYRVRKTVCYCQGWDVTVGFDRCFKAYHTSKLSCFNVNCTYII